MSLVTALVTDLVTESRPHPFKDDETLRFYLWGPREAISVTSVLSLVEDTDFSKTVNNYERKHGPGTWPIYVGQIMLVGTYMHYNIGCELAAEARIPKPVFEPTRMIPPHKMEDLDMMMSYWADFKRQARPRAYNAGVERFLWHSSGYAGRVDLVCQFASLEKAVEKFPDNVHVLDDPHPADVWVVDLKSSKAVYEGYRAQVWAYFKAWNERFPRLPAHRMAILRTGHNGWDFIETSGDAALWDNGMEEARNRGLIR